MLIDAQKVDQLIGGGIALVVSPRQDIGNIVVAEKYQFVDRKGDFGPGRGEQYLDCRGQFDRRRLQGLKSGAGVINIRRRLVMDFIALVGLLRGFDNQ